MLVVNVSPKIVANSSSRCINNLNNNINSLNNNNNSLDLSKVSVSGACNYCKQRGHKARDCWKKQADLQNGQQSSTTIEEEQLLITAHQSYAMFEPV
ncbi:hypothetical protein R1flu_007628 [Riccia fluitans]|uniref:CCHC-type domain-containing protein n=1 Tax=Riccia fluitans TaxID=41844 RepID=A0ABD1Z0L2_9MARC